MKELKGVKDLWHIDWYDGPLSGICEYQGKPYFYWISGDNELEYEHNGKKYFQPSFYLYKISNEDFEKQKTWHELDEMFRNIKGDCKKISDAYWRYFSRGVYGHPEPPKEDIIGFTYFRD